MTYYWWRVLKCVRIIVANGSKARAKWWNDNRNINDIIDNDQ